MNKTIIIGLVIYFIGFLASYIWQKIEDVINKQERDWDDVKNSLKISIFSWISIIALLILLLDKIKLSKIKLFKIKLSNKPPKWL